MAQCKEGLPAAEPHVVATPRRFQGRDEGVLWPHVPCLRGSLCVGCDSSAMAGSLGQSTLCPSDSACLPDSQVHVSRNLSPESYSGYLPSVRTGANQFHLELPSFLLSSSRYLSGTCRTPSSLLGTEGISGAHALVLVIF